MPKVGVVLSGSGVFDGSELHEAVITLLALDRSGAEVICMAPDIDQAHVINHLTGEVAENEKRNVLVESARIARGNIKNIKDVSASDFDALMFPGGFGAAKNLSDFAFKGPDCSVNAEVERIFRETYEAKKPIAAVCIAPALASKVMAKLGKKVKLTIGEDEDTANAINAMGADHIKCPVKETVIDAENKIISSPAYMTGQSISEVAESIENTVKELLKMI